jgi:hypothetical protein
MQSNSPVHVVPLGTSSAEHHSSENHHAQNTDSPGRMKKAIVELKKFFFFFTKDLGFGIDAPQCWVLAARTGYVQDARSHACQWGLLYGNVGLAKLIKPRTSIVSTATYLLWWFCIQNINCPAVFVRNGR